MFEEKRKPRLIIQWHWVYYPIVVCFTAENNDQAREKHQKTLLYFSSLVGSSRTFNEDLFWLHCRGPFGFLGAAVWWFAGPMPGIDVEPTFHPTNSHAMSVLSRFETQETHARELKQVSSSLSCTTESLRVGICSKRISKRYLRVASGEKPSRAGPSKAGESSQLLAQPWWPKCFDF